MGHLVSFCAQPMHVNMCPHSSSAAFALPSLQMTHRAALSSRESLAPPSDRSSVLSASERWSERSASLPTRSVSRARSASESEEDGPALAAATEEGPAASTRSSRLDGVVGALLSTRLLPAGPDVLPRCPLE